ncbi:hypothetical protein [Polynucleobacter sp. es-EL-1]|uniref:hypothetical protein n=1 Tax=Polynucleobacter sp. es-EL-1 TaxID=1855652 RepID=UPI001BFDA12B|nr:hypothetical protein [Polynucleobacter sp. es-EL-1]QWE09841.1 hypothetical protein FD974_05660 [Polynucleobacter sp. es-EL-1]
MISAFVFVTLLPWQVNGLSYPRYPLQKPLLVAAVVDSARIIGLPKLKLRDSRGNRYYAEKTIMQEPIAVIQASSDQMLISRDSLRKTYIQSYVRR